MVKLLICGDRNWADMTAIEKVLDYIIKTTDKKAKNQFIVIEGGATGADTLSRLAATNMGIHTAEVRALWEYYHKAAGPIRNTMMLALEPNMVIAFHDDLINSRGTRDCCEQSLQLDILTFNWNHKRGLRMLEKIEDAAD